MLPFCAVTAQEEMGLGVACLPVQSPQRVGLAQPRGAHVCYHDTSPLMGAGMRGQASPSRSLPRSGDTVPLPPSDPRICSKVDEPLWGRALLRLLT